MERDGCFITARIYIFVVHMTISLCFNVTGHHLSLFCYA